MGDTMKRALLTWLLTSYAAAQVTPYSLQVQTGPGLVAFTFLLRSRGYAIRTFASAREFLDAYRDD